MINYDGPLLERLESSSKRPKVGDIFAIKIAMKGFYLGRVVKSGVKPVSEAKDNNKTFFLVYIYDTCIPAHELAEVNVDSTVSLLRRDRLLLPPFIETVAPWKLGVYKTLDNRPLCEGDVWPMHFFYKDIWRVYLNEYAEAIEPTTLPGQPIGWSGMDNIPMLDLRLRKVLGFDRPEWDIKRIPSPYADY